MSTTVTYKGSTLTTVNNQTRTLKTAGKYMEGDVTLTDTSSTIVVSETLDANGGIIKTITTTDEVNLQTKTITPTSSVQTVNPDTGYDGFSQVIVNAGGEGGNSGYVWQDENGYVHLDDEGSSPITIEPLSVTQNGTYTASTGHAYSPITVNVPSGASNYISGEFTVGETTGIVETHTIPYTGTGYPIAGVIVVKDGMYNSYYSDWYNLVQQYAVGCFQFAKNNRTAPFWSTSSTNTPDSANTTVFYKSSASNATSYSQSGSYDAKVFRASSINPSASAINCVKFVGNAKTLAIYVADASYGLASGITYEYHIIYSS